MIIDGHTFVHEECDGFGGDYDAALESLLAELANSAVDKALLLPIECESAYIKTSRNEFVAKCCEEHPDKLLGFASVHPHSKDAVRRFEEAVKDLGLKGLKVHPRFQGLAANDPSVVALVRKAQELNVPVAIDCMLWKPTPLRSQTPFNIDDLCKAVPEAHIVMCHAGGFHFLDALAVVKANDNVYLDLSLMVRYFDGTPFEEQFMFVLKQVGARRLIYGSDHPQDRLGETYELSRRVLTKHGFSDEELEFVFGKTLLSILP